ncbi:MAG: cysteine--tRNA ligase [Rhizobiaceae bacterium]|nr:cysteine--tRNA ligase [Rhizobiaceae bacterium]
MAENPQTLRLYNTLTRSKEVFSPIDPANVRMYVCGPTVYDYAHIGNARPAIVFDVLYRLLRHVYGADHVTYVRNITDVDDKINARALRDYGADIAAGRLGLNEAIRKVTEPTYEQYQKDVTALGCLPPDQQPRATEFVLPRADGKADMVSLIQSLINRGHAYAAAGEILFDTTSMAEYGRLSRRNLDEQQAGARVAVDAHKKNPADFVLWKESSADEPGWDGVFRIGGQPITIHGRPGWHIECSAMSAAYLGEVFDIHGGGLDLIFPHHENEIAQSRCAHGTAVMANVWMHNGFLQVEGKKMSKSDGNFVTIHELLETDKFGGRKWPGDVLRLAMLMTHYREPIDFSVRRLEEADATLTDWAKRTDGVSATRPSPAFLEALTDDLSSAAIVAELHALRKSDPAALKAGAELMGVNLESHRTRSLTHRYEGPQAHKAISEEAIGDKVSNRLALIREKNWAAADSIRDELLAQGIQLKDGKDPATGERITTWEVKR